MTYVLVEPFRSRAVCSCGWSGKRRLFKGAAKVDALTHSTETGHLPTGMERDVKVE